MSIDTTIDLGRPVSGDVVDLILDDHRRFEDLLRQLRSTASDRDAVRQAFAALHVAHAEAEERHVYPQLKKRRAVDAHEADHGEHEHAEGNEALLAVLECASTDTQKFDDGSRATVYRSKSLGQAFATERNQQIDADCGRTENVRRLVEEARAEGLID